MKAKFKLESKPKRSDYVSSADRKKIHYCLYCASEFYPGRETEGKYCSRKCIQKNKCKIYICICKFCKKEFEVDNIWDLNNRGSYCSDSCIFKEYHINDEIFNTITHESAYWMGFIWSQVYLADYSRLMIKSNQNYFDKFREGLQSDYPVIKYGKRYILTIYSSKMMKVLMTYGLTSNIKKEFPNIPEDYHNDFVRGYFDSDNGYHYKEYGKDVVVLHGKSSKLMRQINDIVKGEMIYSKKEWVIISRDFIKFDGYPKDEKRWEKFNI